MQFKIITGRSGSGKSVVLKSLEDLGYYCVDNMPINLLSSFIEGQKEQNLNIAISIDVRNLPQNQDIMISTIKNLPHELNLDVFFIDADDETLLRRFSETRRLHPLIGNHFSLEQALAKETQLLAPLKEIADKIIHTKNLSIHDLSETIRKLTLGKKEKELLLLFESFGFKYGLPNDADFVFDVRFLPNPHWDEKLKPLTGLDEAVIDFFNDEEDVNKLSQQLIDFIETWMPALKNNNRSFVTIAIGCTGGQHRSVFIAQHLYEYFQQAGQHTQIRHRTLEKKP